ncbi:MAG: hypothetical protein GY768_04735 [Planctomycetaceae bacterium]|nr:hypothetical protein [Planctomycetaceae bacterium]
MARHSNDREDLLREAVRLVHRVEFRPLSFADPVVIGFRENGAASLFVGPDETYQFNSDQQLRRAHWQGELIKADRGSLIGLNRFNGSNETLLLRHEFNAEEMAELLVRLRRRIEELRQSIESGQFDLVGEVSLDDRAVIEMTHRWLATLADADSIEIAHRPNVY